MPKDEVKENFDRLLTAVQKTAKERAARLQGMIAEALIEERNEKDETLMTGRLSNNMLVHLPLDGSYLGKIVTVSLDECHGFYYMGHMV